jgi:hypothetical protein
VKPNQSATREYTVAATDKAAINWTWLAEKEKRKGGEMLDATKGELS